MSRKVNLSFDENPSIHHIYNFNLAKPYIKNKIVLDIGCWTGQIEKLASKYTKKITGLDPSKEAIKIAKTKNKTANFIVGSATKLKFPKQSFDTVIFVEVIEHIPQGTEKIAIKEINRVLKPKGHLILSTPNNNIISIMLDPAFFLIKHRHYSVKEITNLLEKENFQIKKIYKTGGIFFLTKSILETICKYSLGKKPKISWLERRVEAEYQNVGFATIHFIAQKKSPR
jgi:ubiquinone/menaquinone biosynthesis C-methylase UbiE